MIYAPSVLLVEDSPDDAYFFQRALRKSGFSCALKHALNGREAIDILGAANIDRARLPDAVFLDLKMPVMNGFEVLEWVQQQPFAAHVRIIVLSGSNQQDDRDRAKTLGASGYLVKPIASEDILAALSAAKLGERVTA